MNAILASVHPPDIDEQAILAARADLARISAIDRLSLRVGFWLLLRSARRIRKIRPHDHEQLRAAARAQLARENLAASAHLVRAFRA